MAEFVGTLYTYPQSFRAYKVLIAAGYSNKKVKCCSEAPDFKFGETNKTPHFLSKFPLGKVPAFESADGHSIFESNAITYYVANDQLRGQNGGDLDASFVLQWISFADNEILPAAANWVFPCLGAIQYNKQATERAKEDIKRAMSILDAHLSTRTFLVGERVSLADICVACNMLQLYEMVFDPSFREPYVNVNRWFTTLVSQDPFQAVIGNFKFCEKMAQFDGKKFAELQQAMGLGSAKKDKSTAKKQTQQQPKKEKAKPTEEKHAEGDTGDQEEEEAPKPKESKDPFAALPAGSFIMDEWKRTYSNTDIRKEALPYFFEKFDPEHYSVWRCVYKYPEDLRMLFMTSNLVGGMFQRLDKLRKYGFGVMLIFGENNDNTISGLWIWRGHDLAFTLHDDLQVDYESYEWTRLDYNDPTTKSMIENYWISDTTCSFPEMGGKPYSDQGKVFK